MMSWYNVIVNEENEKQRMKWRRKSEKEKYICKNNDRGTTSFHIGFGMWKKFRAG